MNCVCPPKSWEELSESRQRKRKSLQLTALFAACMSASVRGCDFARVGAARGGSARLCPPTWLYYACGSAAAFIQRARFCAEMLHCITGWGGGGGGGAGGGKAAPSLFNRLQKPASSLQKMKTHFAFRLPRVKSFITLNICHFSLCIIHLENAHFVEEEEECGRQLWWSCACPRARAPAQSGSGSGVISGNKG